jgi:hypothetical protein
MLGDLHYQQSKYAEAKGWFEKAAACPVVTEIQKLQKAEAEKKAGKC